MSYTKGPWRFTTEPQPNGCPIIGNCNGLMIAMLAHSVNTSEQRGEALANARLIAAAPELLEALQDARDMLTSHPDFQHDGSLAQYDKVIEKALGTKTKENLNE